MTAVPIYEGTDPVGGKVVRPVGLGILHRNDRFPHLYWQNFLSVGPASELSADVLIAEAERVFADLPIRHVLVADANAAERLRPGFLKGGYQEAVLVTMLLRRPPDREPPTAHLVELSAAELGPAVEAYVRGDPRAEEPERGRELCMLKKDLARNGVRFSLRWWRTKSPGGARCDATRQTGKWKTSSCSSRIEKGDWHAP